MAFSPSVAVSYGGQYWDAVATVIIRLALTAPRIWDAGLALGAGVERGAADPTQPAGGHPPCEPVGVLEGPDQLGHELPGLRASGRGVQGTVQRASLPARYCPRMVFL